MERKISDVFNFDGKKFEVIEGDCEDCYFLTKSCCFKRSVFDIIGECYASDRKDNENVCFELIEE